MQKANNSAAWQAVVASWESAIGHLKAVPQSDPNDSTAQQKIEEYQSNLDYARQNYLNFSLRDAVINPASTPEAIQTWIDQGANPRFAEPAGGGPIATLAYAAAYGNDYSVRILLHEGATWNLLTSKQLDQALIGAACTGFISNVKELLQAGANPNTTSVRGETSRSPPRLFR